MCMALGIEKEISVTVKKPYVICFFFFMQTKTKERFTTNVRIDGLIIIYN